MLGMDKSPVRQEAQLLPSPSPRSLANFKRSLSRRSISSVPHDGAAAMVDTLASRGELVPNQYRSDLSLENTAGKEKRKLFARREEPSSTATNSTGKGMVRKVSSRSFFGVNRDKSQDANASSDTLASVSTTSTTRMELAKKAGEALSKTTTALPAWSRRNRKSIVLKKEDVASAEDIVGRKEEGQRGSFTSTAEEKFSDLTPRGEGSQTMTNLSSGFQGTMTNGEDLQNRGEGLPKRLSGWLSGMLTTSTSNLDEQRNGHLSASDSHATVRRKTSTLSLSKNNSSDRLSSTLPQNLASSNGSQTSTPRPRNSGLLSTLTASGRARAEAASSPNGAGARSGLDRAFRYFLDSGDQQQRPEEGMWLLGVWHGPAHPYGESVCNSERQPVTTVSPNVRDSRSSMVEGDESSARRQDSDAEHDDASTGNSTGRTRETSPSVASTSTGGSLGRADKVRTPEEDIVIARNPPTPQPSKTATKSALPLSLTSNALLPTRQQERTGGANSSTASYVTSFQADFSSRIWCTYRSQFPPINRDGSISSQAELAAKEVAAAQSSSQGGSIDEATISGRGQARSLDPSSVGVNQFGQVVAPATSSQGTLGSALGMHSSMNGTLTTSLSDKMGIPNLWSRATAAAQSYGLGGRAGLTTDAGWGCMLRTGQSVLANALLNVHLSRSWRRAPIRMTEDDAISQNEEKGKRDYAKYVELLSWFMDEPSLACPFGVHRMAREGKRLGKEVGEWFGPSTAAGAIKKLVDDFPEAGLGVTLSSDGVIYLDQVRSQAQMPSSSGLRSGSNNSSGSGNSWTRPVLVLIGVRLGLEGVHPMYYDSIKATFSFPHSVGIAGGRPSSSYYFVGYQGNNLFYLDPHHVRPSIPFRHPPPNLSDEDSWWLQAYSETELSTFHNDRPRRMPMKSLDPSMLLGFLLSDEDSLHNFITRVKALPRPIFSVLDSMPRWMMEAEEPTLHDEEKALESFSESSFDDGLARDGEPEGSKSLQGHGSDENHAGEDKQREEVDPVEMSSNTMTPQTESTFEFIDRQMTGPSLGPLPRKYSDAGSAWEEVSTENGQHRGMSSPVEASFPRSSSS